MQLLQNEVRLDGRFKDISPWPLSAFIFQCIFSHFKEFLQMKNLEIVHHSVWLQLGSRSQGERRIPSDCPGTR